MNRICTFALFFETTEYLEKPVITIGSFFFSWELQFMKSVLHPCCLKNIFTLIKETPYWKHLFLIQNIYQNIFTLVSKFYSSINWQIFFFLSFNQMRFSNSFCYDILNSFCTVWEIDTTIVLIWSFLVF
jgi:hypothetical protein